MFSLRTFWSLSVVVVLATSLRAAPPLHDQIDRLVEAHPSFKESAPELDTERADDATFLRRIYLDLLGAIPNADQVREFLSDTTSKKRRKLIDSLLTSPEHARRMQYVFDEMLMERKVGKHVTSEAWRSFLRQSFQENKPWDEFVREMLTADGSDQQTRPAAKFLLDRELRMDNVTRDLARIFLGRDLQCAQCHDHPRVDDYEQKHYFGLMAFLKRSYLFKDPKTGLTSIGEKAEGDVEFTSVFTSETDQTAPRMLDLPPLADPPPEKEPYKVKRSKTTRSVPVYSRRMQLASAMTADANVAFRLNIANRIWALMMGRGLVEPLDMMHAENAPSHPEVLQLLSDSLLENKYDLRFLLRELALSKTYQRSSQSSVVSANQHNIDSGSNYSVNDYSVNDYSVGQLKPLSPEQLVLSMMKATGALTGEPAASATKLAQQDRPLQKNIEAFVKVFGAAGQTTQFDAAAEQALFLRNDNLLQTWLGVKNGLVEKLLALSDQQVGEEFYLGVFSRMPTDDEIEYVTKYLKNKKDRRAALLQLVWAGLVSVEFRFNH